MVGQVFSEEPYGVGLPRDDVALRNKVNDILQITQLITVFEVYDSEQEAFESFPR